MRASDRSVFRETPIMDGLIKEIERLREAHEALASVYLDPNLNKLGDTVRFQVERYFGFDDSE